MQLQPHPDTPCAAVSALRCEALRAGALLQLRFELYGALDEIRIPPPAAPARQDCLWRHTCFEAFVRGAGESYAELNFSPSSAWAAYAFSAYRTDMASLGIAPPRIATERTQDRLLLEAEALLPAEGVWDVALCAVIESMDGPLSYWALRHAPGKPDFHHADGFALRLPAHDQPA